MKPTQEQVIAWAREAGIPDANIQLIAVGRLETGAELLQTAFTLAYSAGRKDENEACAKAVREIDDYQSPAYPECIQAIRARREQ